MEKLIAKVQELPLLYNTSHPDYMKISLKDSIWQTIAEELKYEDGTQVKTMWLKLRNCHRDALRRRSRKSASGSSSAKPWKYERQMDFLLQYMANRTASGQFEVSLNDTDGEYRIKSEDESTFVKEHQEAHDPFQESNELDNVSESSFEAKPSTKASFYRKRKRSKICGKRAEERARRCHDACRHENDELYHFYMSMYNITKALPLNRQIIIKRKIFNAVTEEQEQGCIAEEKEDK